MASYSSGAQGGVSFSAPRYKFLKTQTIFNSVAGVNPLDNHLPHEFSRIIGLQKITVTRYVAGVATFYWQVEVEGGSNSLSNGYQGAYDQSANYIVAAVPVNCSTAPITIPPPVDLRINRYLVSTVDPGVGNAAMINATYTLALSPYPSVPPTIQLNAGFTLGADDLDVKVEYVRIYLA